MVYIIYKIACVNYQYKNGKIKEYYSRGCLKSETYYKDYKKIRYVQYSVPFDYEYVDSEGYSHFVSQNNVEYDVSFENDLKNGLEVRYEVDDSGKYPKQIKEYSCYWKRGVKDGEEFEYDKYDKEIHIINWKNNEKNGVEMKYAVDEAVNNYKWLIFECYWNNGKKDGVERKYAVVTFNNYRYKWLIFECNWKNDIKDGAEFVFDMYTISNSIMYKKEALLVRSTTWKNGKKDGVECLYKYGKTNTCKAILWKNDEQIRSYIDDNYKLKDINEYASYGGGGDSRDFYDYSVSLPSNFLQHDEYCN